MDINEYDDNRKSRFLELTKYESTRFQESLNRCVLTCQDSVKDKVSPATPEAEVNKYRMEFESCAIKCCDISVAKLPNLAKKVEETMKTGQF
jgi:hypothetical protein